MVCIHNIDVELKKDKNIRELKYSMNSTETNGPGVHGVHDLR